MISSRTGRPAGTPRAARGPETHLPRLSQAHRKQPQDTEQGCRGFAEADLASAGELGAGWPRARMEHSAAAWTTRADLLHRLETGISAARRKADAAAAGDER